MLGVAVCTAVGLGEGGQLRTSNVCGMVLGPGRGGGRGGTPRSTVEASLLGRAG